MAAVTEKFKNITKKAYLRTRGDDSKEDLHTENVHLAACYFALHKRNNDENSMSAGSPTYFTLISFGKAVPNLYHINARRHWGILYSLSNIYPTALLNPTTPQPPQSSSL